MKVVDTSTLHPDTFNSETLKLWVYNGLDCCLTYEIKQKVEELLDPNARRVYSLSRAMQAPVLEMNMRGIKVDIAKRDELVATLERECETILANFNYLCRSIFGHEVNPRSPDQVKKLFYEWLNLPAQKKRDPATKKMKISTDRDSLEKLAVFYTSAKTFVRHILVYRDKQKLAGTLKTSLSPDGRFRTNLSIAGTKTGRLASAMSDFSDGGNLQNIDSRIKEIFIADEGMKFANIDLEQADARNVGAMIWLWFNDSKFLDAAESGDLHTTVCRMCWRDLDWSDDPKHNRSVADQVAYRGKSYRDLAKVLGHGTNFNGQPATMAKHTKVDKPIIEDFQARYFGAFPSVRKRIEEVKMKLLSGGRLTTVFGRSRHFLGRRDDPNVLNEACAYDPQSMTADEINYAMVRVWALNKVQFMIQVHDSLLLQYPEELEDEILPLVMEAMKVPITIRGRTFTVPCETAVGWNWGYLKYDKATGHIISNRNGMVKYKGHDDRTRQT